MIHSYRDNSYSGFNPLKIILVKAIIKKSTKFYISYGKGEIASESLYITNELINPTDEYEETDLSEYID